MRLSIMLQFVALFTGFFTANASLQSELEKAAQAGKVVFLVVSEAGNQNEAKALAVAKDAQAAHPKSVVLTLDRTKASNAALVKKWALGSVPLPIILVIAQNGVLAGGISAAQATASSLGAMVPTPAKAEVLKVIQAGNAVFLVVGKSSAAKSKALENCGTACGSMNNKAKTVFINFSDPAEKGFLKELRITSVGDEPLTYVINNSGQITGTFTGTTNVNALVAAATKKAASGCCPTGSGKSCN